MRISVTKGMMSLVCTPPSVLNITMTATCAHPRTRNGHTDGRGTRAPSPSEAARASSSGLACNTKFSFYLSDINRVKWRRTRLQIKLYLYRWVQLKKAQPLLSSSGLLVGYYRGTSSTRDVSRSSCCSIPVGLLLAT